LVCRPSFFRRTKSNLIPNKNPHFSSAYDGTSKQVLVPKRGKKKYQHFLYPVNYLNQRKSPSAPLVSKEIETDFNRRRFFSGGREKFPKSRKLRYTTFFIPHFLQSHKFLNFTCVEMKVVSLFSGIGGLDLGLEQAGHEVILQVENDPHCLQVLQRHFPGREIRRDVAELTELPAETELLAAGFPCEVRHIFITYFPSNPFKGCEHNEP
jgi:hypothetical protein